MKCVQVVCFSFILGFLSASWFADNSCNLRYSWDFDSKFKRLVKRESPFQDEDLESLIQCGLARGYTSEIVDCLANSFVQVDDAVRIQLVEIALSQGLDPKEVFEPLLTSAELSPATRLELGRLCLKYGLDPYIQHPYGGTWVGRLLEDALSGFFVRESLPLAESIELVKTFIKAGFGIHADVGRYFEQTLFCKVMHAYHYADEGEKETIKAFIQWLLEEHTDEGDHYSNHLEALFSVKQLSLMDLELAELLLNKGANPNFRDLQGTPLLHVWVARCHSEACIVGIEFLLKHGADLFAEDSYGDSLLDKVRTRSDDTASLIDYLEALGVQPGRRVSLLNAIETNDFDEVRRIVELGFDLNQSLDRSLCNVPLYLVTKRGYLNIAEYLLDQGACVDGKLLDQVESADRCADEIPLGVAIRSGDKSMVDLLLDRGANMLSEKRVGGFFHGHELTELPLLEAVQYEDVAIIKSFIQHGFNIKVGLNTFGQTIAYFAALFGHLDILRYVYEEEGMPLDIRDELKQTPLLAAVVKGHLSVIAYLVKQGADIYAEDVNGRTPLSLADERGFGDLLRYWSGEQPDFEARFMKSIIQKYRLYALWLEGGKHALKDLVNSGKVLVGVVTHRGTDWDRVTYINDKLDHPNVILGYLTAEMLEDEGIEDLFDGFIFPGENDSFMPGAKSAYSAQDLGTLGTHVLPAEILYQRWIPRVLEKRVPMMGICAGAQHLMMAHGGSIGPAGNQDVEDAHRILEYTVPYFMMLSQEKQDALLDRCEADPINLYKVYRQHAYAVLRSSIDNQDGFELAGESLDGDVMAFSKGFLAVATQFHPEDYYFEGGDSPYQKRYLDTFIKLCEEHALWRRLAKSLNVSEGVMLDLRDAYLKKVEVRLAECREALAG